MLKQHYGVLVKDDFTNIQLLDENKINNIKYNNYIIVEEIYNRNQNGNGKVTFLDGDNSLLSLQMNNWKLNPSGIMEFNWQGIYFFYEYIDPEGKKKELSFVVKGLTKFSHPHIFDLELKFAYEKLRELSKYPDWRFYENLERIEELEEENEKLKKEIESLKNRIEEKD